VFQAVPCAPGERVRDVVVPRACRAPLFCGNSINLDTMSRSRGNFISYCNFTIAKSKNNNIPTRWSFFPASETGETLSCPKDMRRVYVGKGDFVRVIFFTPSVFPRVFAISRRKENGSRGSFPPVVCVTPAQKGFHGVWRRPDIVMGLPYSLPHTSRVRGVCGAEDRASLSRKVNADGVFPKPCVVPAPPSLLRKGRCLGWQRPFRGDGENKEDYAPDEGPR